MRSSESSKTWMFDMLSTDRRSGASVRVVPPNVELFAACSSKEKTPRWKNSFTEVLIKVLGEVLSDEGASIKVSTLAKIMLESKTILLCQPHYLPLEQDYLRSIYLQHFPSIEMSSAKETAMTSMDITFSIPTEDDFRDMLSWLQSHPPRIKGLECKAMYPYTQACRSYVQEQLDLKTNPTAPLSIPENWKAKTYGAWQIFVNRLVSWASLSEQEQNRPTESPRTLMSELSFEDQEDIIVREILEAWTTLQRTIERNVLSRPGLEDDEVLSKALDNQVLRDLGLSGILTMRWFAKHPATASGLEVHPSHLGETGPFETPHDIETVTRPGMQSVLVEYKKYDSEQIDKSRFAKYCDRIGSLAEALKRASSEKDDVLRRQYPYQFHTLTFNHWFVDPKNGRFCLEFQFPQLKQACPITLYDILSDPKAPRPDLGQRLSISKKIGGAVFKWLNAGWVHQGISSHNIVFFHPPGERAKIDFTNPYLCGFQYSREAEDRSLTLSADKEFGREIYRHPERQGNIVKQYKPKHDIYSFGALLLDLGNWESIDHLFKSGRKKSHTPAAVCDKLVRNIPRLKFYAGIEYAEAARRCIEQDLKINGTNAELLASFEDEVLAKLHDGSGI
jgi:hypothetical protein